MHVWAAGDSYSLLAILDTTALLHEFLFNIRQHADPIGRAVRGRSLAGTEGSNPAEDTDVCLLRLLCVDG